MNRPDWTIPINRKPIDLSRNVHYDNTINNRVNEILAGATSVLNYPDEFILYKSISDFYKIPITNLAIGFGATEVIERALRSLDYQHVYIVEPQFEMVEIYCKILNKPYSKVTVDSIPNDPEGILYICNPNGNNGQTVDVRPFLSRFKHVILDEVYSDFSKENSLLYAIPDNTVIVKSLSKSLGFAGLRVGFAIGNSDIISKLQAIRMNYITSSISVLVVQKLINETDNVISRMNETKEFLEKKFELPHSHGNYVLFKSENIYTDTFGCKFVDGFYRMALTDLNTLYEYTST